MSARLWVILGWLVAICLGQTTHMVTVGQEGSFYDPMVISAELGDNVTFIFSGLFHGVTQSSFDAPCSPLAGGFSAGLQGVGNNTSSPPPVWTITITNVSEPIWFFCEATRPSSHCNAGMVGVINPPSIDMFNQFQAVAKTLSGTPAPTPTVVLSGIGAVAAASPAPTTTLATTGSSSPTSSSTSTPSSTSSSTSASPTQAAVVPKANHTAVIGGAVGGGIAVVIIVGLLFLLYRSRNRTSATRPVAFREKGGNYGDGQKVGFLVPQRTGGSEGFMGPPYSPGLVAQDQRRRPEEYTHARGISYSPSSPSISENMDLPIQSIQPYVDQYANTRSVHGGNLTNSDTAQTGTNVDVHEIAKEVVALLQPTLESQRMMPQSQDIQAPRPVRQLPDPRMLHMKSPGPPQYNP